MYGQFTTTGQIQALKPYGDNFNWSMSPYGGRGTGIPIIDQFMLMSMGNRMYPLPQPGARQGVHDAFWQRDRNMEQLQIRNHALANSLLFKKTFGSVNTDSPLWAVMGSMINNPDGVVARGMSPLIGGNPIKAQMAAFANMRGATMTGFGTVNDMNTADMAKFNDILNQNFYNYRQVDKDVLQDSHSSLIMNARKKGVSGSMLNKVNDLFNKNDFSLRKSEYKNFQKEVETIRDITSKMESVDFKDAKSKKQAQKAVNEIVESIKDPATRREISQAVAKAMAEGNVEAFKKSANVQGIDTVARQLEMHAALKIGDKMPTSINFANTYGFNQEDLTSAYYTSGANRMISNKSGKLASLDKFVGAPGSNTVAALDSLRGLFGNQLSGKELVEQLNQFAGVSDISLDNGSGAKRIESLARGIKSLARNANISIEHLLDIINTAKEVASSTPGLQNLGGVEIGEMVINKAPQLMAALATTSDRTIRQAGGTAGFMNQVIGGQLKQASEPISLQLAALHTRFQGNSGAQSEIRSFAERGNLTWPGYSYFLKNLSGKYGQNFQEMYSYAESNVAAQNIGMAESPVFQKAGGRAAQQAFFQQVNANVGGGARGKGALQSLSTLLSGSTVDIDEYIDQIGSKGLDTADSVSNNFSKTVRRNFEAQKDKLKAEGINNLEELLNATPEVRQKFGGLYDQASSLKNRLTSRMATQYDSQGRVISAAGQDSVLSKFDVMKAAQFDEQKFLSQASMMGAPMFAAAQDLVKSKAYMSLRENDPTFKKFQQTMARRMSEDKELDTLTAKRLGFLNAPTSTQVFNQILKGGLKEDGIVSLLKPLGLSEDSAVYQDIFRYTKDISKVQESLTFDELGRNLKSTGIRKDDIGATLAEVGDVSKKYGLSGKNLMSISEIKDKARAQSKIRDILGDKAKNFKQSDFDKIINSSINVKSLKLGEMGDINLDTLRNFYAGGKVDEIKKRYIDSSVADIDKNLQRRLKEYSTDKNLTRESRSTAQAILASGLGSSRALEKALNEGFGESKQKDKDGNVLYDIKDKNLLSYAGRMGFKKTSGLTSLEVDKIKTGINEIGITKKAVDHMKNVEESAKKVGKPTEVLLGDISTQLAAMLDTLRGVAPAIDRLRTE